MTKTKSIIAIGGAALILSACAPNAQHSTKTAPLNDTQFTRAATLSAACSGCHTPKSIDIPSLSALSADQIIEGMNTYKNETEGTTVMHRLARGYTEDDIALIAADLTIEQNSE